MAVGIGSRAMLITERTKYQRPDGKLWKRYEVLAELYRYIQAYKTIPAVCVLANYIKMPRTTLRVHLSRLMAEGLIGEYEGRITVPGTNWEPPEDFRDFVE